MKYLLPLLMLSQAAMADSIQTVVNAKVDKLRHLTFYAKAWNTDKPEQVFFDRAVPRTKENQGVLTGLEGYNMTSEHLQTEGPIQVLYRDYANPHKLIPCGQGISQDNAGKQLIQINVDVSYTPEGISCIANGKYAEVAASEEEKDTSTKTAHINPQE